MQVNLDDLLLVSGSVPVHFAELACGAHARYLTYISFLALLLPLEDRPLTGRQAVLDMTEESVQLYRCVGFWA